MEQLQAQLLAIIPIDQQLELVRGGEVTVGLITATHHLGEVAVAALAGADSSAWTEKTLQAISRPRPARFRCRMIAP